MGCPPWGYSSPPRIYRHILLWIELYLKECPILFYFKSQKLANNMQSLGFICYLQRFLSLSQVFSKICLYFYPKNVLNSYPISSIWWCQALIVKFMQNYLMIFQIWFFNSGPSQYRKKNQFFGFFCSLWTPRSQKKNFGNFRDKVSKCVSMVKPQVTESHSNLSLGWINFLPFVRENYQP